MAISALFAKDLLINLHIEADKFNVRGDSSVNFPIVHLNRTVRNAIIHALR